MGVVPSRTQSAKWLTAASSGSPGSMWGLHTSPER